ncbi:putative addiction module antidote protein [Candidatus Dependentiae bacterium]|nr:putative addiction module antidote protein [Candidatus Dependentiae bacterium]
MKKRVFRDYHEKNMNDLQNSKLAIAYLNEALMDEDPRVFLLALKDVCEAQNIDMTELAEKTQLSRENLYRILSPRGNPKLSSIIPILNVVGFSLAVQSTKK